MPLYEYYCAGCQTSFEVLRVIREASQPIACPRCAMPDARRMISRFAAVSKDGSGSRMIASSQGGGGCGGCSGGSCATCGH